MLFTRSAQGPLREPVGFCSVTKETIMEYNVFLCIIMQNFLP